MNDLLTILLVEDNFDHLRLTKYILSRNNVAAEVHVVRDGQEALDYLYGRNKYAEPSSRPRPDIVLLDFNIPRVDGKEVLRSIKTDDGLKGIPVVVVSSSNRDDDVTFAADHGAAAYISKSAGFEQLNEALAGIARFAMPRASTAPPLP